MKTLKALIMLFTIFNLSVTTYAQDFVKIDTEAYDQSYKLWLEQKRQNALIKIPKKVDFQELSELLASNGFGPGNGGNDYIFEVDSIAKDLLTYLESSRDLQSKISLKEFEDTLQTTSLFFIDNLPKLDERVVDALNWQKGKLILIDRTSWKRKSLEMKYKLIFHEYLGVMGLEINNAFFSNQFELNSFLIGQKRFEMDWSGTTYVYSHSNSDEYAVSFSINGQTDDATIVTAWGSSQAKWQERSEKLYLVPQNKIEYVRPAYKSENDIFLSGLTTVKLVDLTIYKSSQDQMIVEETWSNCFVSDDPNQTEYNTCEFTLQRQDRSLIYTKSLKGKEININSGDLVSLPVFKPTSTKLEHLVTKVTNSSLEYLYGLKEDFTPVKKWSQKVNYLEVSYVNGDLLTLTKVKSLRGLDRVIARLKTSQSEYIAVTSFLHTLKSDAPLLTRNEVVGNYLPMYVNSQHTAEEYQSYSFNQDGLGGFDTDDNIGDFFNHWFWSLDNNIIIANRYRDLFNGDFVNSHATLSSCVPTQQCYLHNHRKYIPLKVSGDRYTFLRVMAFYDDEGKVREGTKSSSFWVMDKI